MKLTYKILKLAQIYHFLHSPPLRGYTAVPNNTTSWDQIFKHTSSWETFLTPLSTLLDLVERKHNASVNEDHPFLVLHS